MPAIRKPRAPAAAGGPKSSAGGGSADDNLRFYSELEKGRLNGTNKLTEDETLRAYSNLEKARLGVAQPSGSSVGSKLKTGLKWAAGILGGAAVVAGGIYAHQKGYRVDGARAVNGAFGALDVAKGYGTGNTALIRRGFSDLSGLKGVVHHNSSKDRTGDIHDAFGEIVDNQLKDKKQRKKDLLHIARNRADEDMRDASAPSSRRGSNVSMESVRTIRPSSAPAATHSVSAEPTLPEMQVDAPSFAAEVAAQNPTQTAPPPPPPRPAPTVRIEEHGIPRDPLRTIQYGQNASLRDRTPRPQPTADKVHKQPSKSMVTLPDLTGTRIEGKVTEMWGMGANKAPLLGQKRRGSDSLPDSDHVIQIKVPEPARGLSSTSKRVERVKDKHRNMLAKK
jgi:hypothetical protein